MRNLTLKICFVLMLAEFLGGCAAAAIAGAAAGSAGAVSVAADRRTAGTMLEDEAIELKARQALMSDEELNGLTHVNMTSYNGMVLVTGEAPTEALRGRVVELVRNVEKVRLVFDEMTVGAPSSLTSRSSDTLLTTKVKTSLVTNPDTTAFNVKVVTENGIVYLMGLLTVEEGQRAMETARQVEGVQKVISLFQQSAAVNSAASTRKS
ncbi:MAG: BON domain-containing protein [Gammaproteobacteria bacterium]|nr:BON domain-containing protein [Gammaproteobacteria bacterium]